MNEAQINIYSNDEAKGIKRACELVSSVLDIIKEHVLEGVTTLELNNICHNEIIKNNAIPAPLNYKGFPKSICTSVNNIVCHGIPNERKLKDGDILNIDISLLLDEWYGDSSRMYCVGKPSKIAERLIQATYDSMMKGIEVIKPGNTIGDIGYAIQKYTEDKGYSVVRDYCGHGIGRAFHEQPIVRHYGNKGEGSVIRKGMCFTVEPMINVGGKETRVAPDGWTVFTKDRSLSAQFEHTVYVTDNGCEIFT